jgi:tetratricopeptide (TPR) repeat protein
VLESLGRLSEAADAYDLALAADEAFVGSRMAVVHLHLRAGRFDRALAIIEQTPQPHTLEMRFAHAQALGGLDRFAESEREVRALLADLPRNPEYLLYLSDLQIAQDNPQQAEATLLSIVDFDGANEPAYAALFELYRRDARRFSDASVQRLLQRAQLNIPDSRTARYELAVWYIRNDRLQQAEPLLRALVEREADDFEALRALATVLVRAGKTQDAAALLLEQINKGPMDSGRMVVYWGLLTGIDGPQTAAPLARLMERVAELPPRQEAEFHYVRAILLHGAGRTQEYRAAVAEALTADPEHPGANNDLGYLMVEENRDLPRALEMIRKAVAAEPDNAAYLDSLGWAHYKLGEFEEALTQLQRAVQLPDAGEDPVIHDHLADTLWRLNRTAEAVERWRDAERRLGDRGLMLQADSVKLRENLRAKLQAAAANAAPPIAPTPAETPPAAPGAATDRAEANTAQPVLPAP